MIGFTNGCFDILHKGHIHLLSMARQNCQYLVVALNTDESVKRLKGLDRPVNKFEKRKAALEALPIVNEVIGFTTEKELLDLVKEINPKVIIKGADYIGRNITSAGYVQKNGGKVILVPLLPGVSTTRIIEDGKR